MKVLLWNDIDKLGRRGEIVDVKDGFARNFLFPRRLASKPTPTMYKEFELEKRRQAKADAKLISDAKVVADRIGEVQSVSIEVNANAEGHLYGSVTPSMISEALRDKGLKVEPKAVEIAEPIKTTGTYEVAVNLHREVKPKLKVWVLSTNKGPAAEGKPAEAKAEEPKK